MKVLININSIQVATFAATCWRQVAIFIGKTYGQLVYLGELWYCTCSSYTLSDYNTQTCAVHAAVYTMTMVMGMRLHLD